MTSCILYRMEHWNGLILNPLKIINERASLVPAAAVIPALKAYIVIAAVKKLVVGFESLEAVLLVSDCTPRLFRWFALVAFTGSLGSWHTYLE